VITTPLTFCATVNTIIHAGATPVLADVDPVTMNIDPSQVEAKITPRTRAIVPVHFAGRACDMDALMAIAERHALTMIEDCAHAIETEYRGRKAGTFGDFGCFSFYATKNIATGEGGLVLAANEELAARVKVLGLHGMSKDAWKRFSDEGYKHYQVVAPGFKYNMMDLQAAIGIHQLARVDQYWKRREDVWNRYNEAFADLPIGLPAPTEPPHASRVPPVHDTGGRGAVRRLAGPLPDAMTAHNIGVGVHYMSVPEHPYYQEALGWEPGDFPHAMRIGRQTVSIPLTPHLSDDDVDDVIEAVRRILA
jgi:dTDP-4-amino-4,6-dideoxygalactose transaminase